jgi:CTP synthase (UTP-ammonia lyase)
MPAAPPLHDLTVLISLSVYQNWIERVAQQPVDGQQGPPDVCLVEVGGTVGDIESSVFLEVRQR